MKKLLLISLFLTLYSFVFAQEHKERFRISFTDKSNSHFSVQKPNEFLSKKAIERRIKQSISIDSADLPVNNWYVDSVVSYGAELCNTSKWFNSIVVEITDSLNIQKIKNLSFVTDFKKVGESTKPSSYSKKILFDEGDNYDYDEIKTRSLKDFYGQSYSQLAIMNGTNLHKDGYMGQGMLVGIIDAGFFKVDSVSAFEKAWEENRIIAYKDFSGSNANVLEEGYHGMAVFSLIGSYLPGKLIGTAPRANYILLRSEEENTEFSVEEENWIAAIEFADSLGVDVVNSSLGYSSFDDTVNNYSYRDMNGKTSRISQAASIAAKKGILVVTSAGNSGAQKWKYITTPGDANNILTIGACFVDSTIANFSSSGPTFDGRVKPEVTTLGVYPAVVRDNGIVENAGAGTSFSSPLLAGMATCLWQEFPLKTEAEIRNAIIKSANNYNTPKTLSGFGIPDFEKARQLLRSQTISNEIDLTKINPNPFAESILEILHTSTCKTIKIELFCDKGFSVFKKDFSLDSVYSKSDFNELEKLQKGSYSCVISYGKIHKIKKVSKI